MRLSREKINILSHCVADRLAEIDEVTFREDRNTIRLEALQVINKWMTRESEMDQAARHKIESQAKAIPEGSEEWDILYRKYYEEELQTLTGRSVGFSSEARQQF
jgi:hypothetical protein